METNIAKYWAEAVEQHQRRAYRHDEGQGRYPFFEVRLNLIDDLLKECPPKRLLDAGCGAGQILAHFLNLDWDGVGVDLVPGMVELARATLTEAGHNPNRVSEGDVIDLSIFPDESFDLILSVGVMEYLRPDEECHAFAEARRLLKPDGLFLVENINKLFDLTTFNRFTINFFAEHFIPAFFDSETEKDRVLGKLNGLVAYPERPDPEGKYSTTRDEVYTKGEISIEYARKVCDFGFEQIEQAFYRFHSVPPLLFEEEPDLETVSIERELALSRHWIGNFLASGFIAVLKKTR